MQVVRLKIFLTLVTLIFLGLYGFPAQPARADDSDQSIADNQRIEQTLISALSSKDLDAVMKLYWHSPDLVVVFPNGNTVKGWDNVRTAYQGYISAIDSLHGSLSDTTYLTTGDTVLATGLFSYDIVMKGGGGTDHEAAQYVNVRQKKDGQWVIVMDRIQPAAPTPAPSPTK